MNSPAFASPTALGATAFRQPTAISARPHASTRAPPRRANVTMISETNIAKKAKKVEAAKACLEGTTMMFSTPLEGLSVSDIFKLKLDLPEGTKCATVKNTLMRRAMEGTEWEVAGDLTSQSSLWFFIRDDIKGSVKAYETMQKELKRDDIKGGVFEGEKYDLSGIQAIAALPTKQELMQKLAIALKMVPTKIGRSINMVPTKLARAVKLAIADEDQPTGE